MVPACGRPVEEVHLLQGLKTLAYVMEQPGGEVYAPLFEKLEMSLAEKHRARAPIDRARRLLDAYTVAGGLNAIR